MDDTSPLKVPPHSIEAERSVLGGLMLDDNAWDRVSSHLAADDFYRSDHRIIYRVMEDRKGNLWVTTVGGGLNRFDRATEKFFHYRHDPQDPNSLSSDEVMPIYEDQAKPARCQLSRVRVAIALDK